MKINIIVDSSADLPIELITKYSISVIPLRIFDEMKKEYADGITLHSNELLSRMKNGELFTTSLPTYESIYDVFCQKSLEGECIYLACSGDLSGTYNFAQFVKIDIVEKYPEAKIEVIDTRSVSLGICVLLLDLLQNMENGDSFELLVSKLNEKITRINHIFTVDDLQYLIRGGRVGKFAGFLGGLLNINPIMEVSEGIFKPNEKVRGRKKALNRICEVVKIRMSEHLNEAVGIVYGQKDDLVDGFINKMKEIIGERNLIINCVGSAVGVHTGPGAVGVFFLGNDTKK